MSNLGVPFSFSTLPLVIRLKCEETGELPLFLGSTIRGVLGWSLLTAKSDIYPYLFDAENGTKTKAHLAKPYLIEPPSPKSIYHKDDELIFTLSLLGEASMYASELIHVLIEQRIFHLGAKRIPFRLLSVIHGSTYQEIWDEKTAKTRIRNLLSCSICPEKLVTEWLSIQFQTPLRIRRRGKLVTAIDFPTIIRNITARLNELTASYGGFVHTQEIEQICELAKDIQQVSSVIRCYEMKRYSNKINEKMDFTGVLGTVTFQGNLTPFTPWLHAAHVLHIGRNTTFGCGKLELVML